MATVCMQLVIAGHHGNPMNQFAIHFLTDDGGTSSGYVIAKDLVNDFDADHIDVLLGLFPSDYAISWIQARRVIPVGSHSFWRDYQSGAKNGTGGSASSATATAPIVKLYPAMGINTQGRIFLPAVDDTDLVDNAYETGYVSNVISTFGGMTTWTGSISSRAYQMAIRSKKLGAAYQVSSLNLSPIIGNLRRRRVPG